MISINPCERRDPRDDRGRAGPGEQPVQPPLAGAPPARLDVQDVRPRRGGRARASTRPRRTTSRRRSRTGRTRNGTASDGGWWCVKTYDSSYSGWTSVERATLALGQLRLRPADPRRRPAARRVARASPRGADAARRARAVRARDGPRLDRGLAARHGLGVRDARGRRASTPSRPRSARSARERKAGRPLGDARTAGRA